ncbi:MAG TPA: tyrosine-type recombinase/integrase, partial [Herpetosiphonaceae bacterium]|nr:tyrosine-type recombinase/integrase [Herpetosiphonaceae bacterium]
MTERLRAVAKLIGLPYESVAWHEFRFQHIDFIRQRLVDQGLSPATVNLTLAAFRGIARYARNLGLITAEEYDRIRDVQAVKGSRLPAGRAVLEGELGALVRTCAADPTPAGTRDAAIFAVLYIGGVRRSELAGLDLADWTPEPPTLRVRHGKGDKER